MSNFPRCGTRHLTEMVKVMEPQYKLGQNSIFFGCIVDYSIAIQKCSLEYTTLPPIFQNVGLE